MQFSDMMYTIEVAIDGNSVMFLKKKPADKAAASKKKTTASKSENGRKIRRRDFYGTSFEIHDI